MCFLYIYEYGTLSVEVILRKGRRKWENNRGNEPNLGTLHAYVEMSQQNPCNKNYKLIKTSKTSLSGYLASGMRAVVA
jgi:hypothetical protein